MCIKAPRTIKRGVAQVNRFYVSRPFARPALPMIFLSARLPNSWREAGFDPVAVNGPAEIEALRNLDLGIEFSQNRRR